MEYEKIYPWTNENLRCFSSDFKLKNKKIFTVTSSGDVKPFSFKNNEYFDKEYYQLLQAKLAVISPVYIDCDIININKKLKDKYDYIFTSNMFYYLMKKGTHVSAFDNLTGLLNSEGRIIQYSLVPHFKNDLYFEKRRNYDARILYKYEDTDEGYYESIISYGTK